MRDAVTSYAVAFAPEEPAVHLRTGVQLDHYRIEGVAARSGMASVFRGVDTRTGAAVAIKVPHPAMEDNLRREEEIGRDLDHPSVMKVFSDEHRSRPYMVMEWVDGRLLREVMRGPEKMPGARAVRIALGICGALDHIHSRGVVHRDLKPENIMVDAEDRVKLIDFGIATQASRRSFRKLAEVRGTPDYISPEQVEGNRGDARSDLYALGVILYEMLTGETPFCGPNAFAVMNDRLHHNPVPPREIEPAVTPQLQEIVYRAMAREPRNRYASAREFMGDLEYPGGVEAAERAELRDWTWRRTPLSRRILTYTVFALIPIVIFTLLLYVARHA